MELIARLGRFVKRNNGITLMEIMIAISILGICMSYIAYDSSVAVKTIHQMDENDKMLYAAQEAMERYKAGAMTDSIDGYPVEVNDATIVASNLKLVTVTVKAPGLSDVVLTSYSYHEISGVPEAPTNVTAIPSATHITLNWTRSIDADSYTVKRRAEGETDLTIIASGITDDKYTDTTVQPGIRYYYVVSATNIKGEGPDSEEVNAIIIVNTDGLTPIADSYVYAANASSNFGAQTALYARNGNNNNKKYKSYLKFDLSPIGGTIISAKLRIYGSASATLNAPTYQVDDDSWTETGVNWNNAPVEGNQLGSLAFNNTSKYVELDVTDYCTSQLAGDKAGGFEFTSPDNTIVTAVSKESTSNKPQLLITWTPLSPPTAPQNLTATPGDTEATLTWSPVIGAENYNVKRSNSPGGTYTTLINTGNTSYTDTSVTNGTTYYYVVSAVNGTGEGANSDEVSTIPNKVTTVTVNPAADTYVRDGSYADMNYGTSAKLEVDNSSISGDKRAAYLRCDLSGIKGEIISAKLRLYGSNMDDSSTVNLGLYSVEDEGWDENTITYNSSPMPGQEIGSVQVDNSQTYREINVTSYIKTVMAGSKVFNVAAMGKDADKLLSFNSKESLTDKPELVIVKTLTKPDAPSNLKAAPDNGNITLSWDAAPEAASYNVKRAVVDGGPYTTIASGITSTTYQNTGLTNGTAYYYVVSAQNASGESANSSQVSGVPNADIVVTLNPIADAKVESYYPNSNFGTDSSINVVNNGISNMKSYLKFNLAGYTNNTAVSAKLRIYGKTDGSAEDIAAYKVSNTTWLESGSGSITWSNAPALETQVGTANITGTQQYYDIDVSDYIAQQLNASSSLTSIGLYKTAASSNTSTFNSREAAAYKPQLIVRMIQGAPKTPQNLIGTGNSGAASLSWSAADGASSYKVKVSTTSGGPYTTKASGLTGTAFTDTSVTNGVCYYYVVSAVNSQGESVDSSEVCVMPSAGQTTRVFYPVADSYVRDGSYASTNYGGDANIYVRYSSTTGSGNNEEGYLRFDLSSLSAAPLSANLMIWGRNITNNKTTDINVYKVSNDTWGEYYINWNNVPGSGSTYATFYVNRTYKQYSVGVTTFAKEEYQGDKKLSINLATGTSGRNISFTSRHNTKLPLLVVTY